MAVLDAVLNNADRKGGHVLRGADGGIYGVDHGVTFNVDDKLRTVLWGWAGEPLTDEARGGARAARRRPRRRRAARRGLLDLLDRREVQRDPAPGPGCCAPAGTRARRGWPVDPLAAF